MALFHRHPFDSMNEPLVDQLEDLYDAESRQCETQTKWAAHQPGSHGAATPGVLR